MIDIYSRYIVGAHVHAAESAVLAAEMMREIFAIHGIPQVVHIEEPRQGVQFGFDMTKVGSSSKAQLQPRDRTTFKDLAVPKIDVPFRAGAGSSGVVDIQALERALKKHPATGAGDGLDAAEYALQLIRFPYRQVFGAPEGLTIGTAFRATIAYSEYVALDFTAGATP